MATYQYNQKPYTGWHLFWDVVLTCVTGGLWLIVVIISAVGRSRNRHR
jgi:hypothetical protein